MYEELVKDLRVCKRYPESCSYCVEENDYCRQRDMCKAADAIEFLQAQVRIYSGAVDETVKMLPIWIPVTERLPESRQSVLCYNEGGQWGQLAWIDIQTYVDEDGASGFWHNRRYEDLVRQVTHWMPLPEPPKEETE